MSHVSSMTGFAGCEGTLGDGRSFSLTIKSVNHRHLDLQVRVPAGMDALEPELRKLMKAAVRRGHVEVLLQVDCAAGSGSLALDEALLDSYLAAYRRAAERFEVSGTPDLHALLRMPGVMTSAVPAISSLAAAAPEILRAVAALLTAFERSRTLEGDALRAELRAGAERLANLGAEARALRDEVIAGEMARLRSRLAELMGGVDVSHDRLLTEAAVLASRADVEEELVRLRTHIQRFIEVLDAGGEVGRQFDFLLQEMNREANTLLAKTGGASGEAGLRLTDVGLAVKLELERAREQVQNLE